MPLALYITHPEVMINPAVPVPSWGLSETGRRRAEEFAVRGLLREDARLFTSTERKAIELAEILAASCAGRIETDAAFGENDRSATGFLAGDAFVEAAQQFFNAPEISYRGWERAIDAQARVVGAVRRALGSLPANQAAVFCGHGGVGTLLKCALAHRPIALAEDQRFMAAPGGGNLLVFDPDQFTLIRDWTAMEDFTG